MASETVHVNHQPESALHVTPGMPGKFLRTMQNSYSGLKPGRLDPPLPGNAVKQATHHDHTLGGPMEQPMAKTETLKHGR